MWSAGFSQKMVNFLDSSDSSIIIIVVAPSSKRYPLSKKRVGNATHALTQSTPVDNESSSMAAHSSTKDVSLCPPFLQSCRLTTILVKTTQEGGKVLQWRPFVQKSKKKKEKNQTSIIIIQESPGDRPKTGHLNIKSRNLRELSISVLVRFVGHEAGLGLP